MDQAEQDRRWRLQGQVVGQMGVSAVSAVAVAVILLWTASADLDRYGRWMMWLFAAGLGSGALWGWPALLWRMARARSGRAR